MNSNDLIVDYNNIDLDISKLCLLEMNTINENLAKKLTSIAHFSNNYDNTEHSFFIDEEIIYSSKDGYDSHNKKNNDSIDSLPKIIIGKIDNYIIGFASIYIIDESSLELCGFVLPKYRNNNIGSALLDAVKNIYYDCYISIPVNNSNNIRDNSNNNNDGNNDNIGNNSNKNNNSNNSNGNNSNGNNITDNVTSFLSNRGFHYDLTECSMFINTKNIHYTSKDYQFNDNINLTCENEDNDSIVFYISLNNQIIGSCYVSIFEGYGCIHDVEISETFRGNGYGKNLLIYTLIILKNLCSNIILHVTHENTPAYNLYKNLGFNTRQEIIYYCNI